MEKLEAEYMERVQKQFNSLINYLRNSADQHIFECSKTMDKLEEILLGHKIRGESIIHETPMQLVETHKSLDKNYNKHFAKENSFLPYSANEVFHETKLISELEMSDVDYGPQEEPEDNERKINKTKLNLNPDKSYLQEVSKLSPKSLPDPKKRKLDRDKTLGSCYHLVSSIMSICDEDNDDLIIKQQEKAKRQKLVSKIRKRKTLHDTLLIMPKADDAVKLLENFKSSQSITPPELDNSTSRWCSVIRNLQITNDYVTVGEVRVSTRTRCPHSVIPGGNFNPVVLGLDSNNRPLAIKRILKCNPVCKVMKTLLNPLLGLRNLNILHYHTCTYEKNELLLATPLCEYNLGEYIMEMKTVPNMLPKYMDMVKQFLAGLRFLHDRREPIVHGNLKPSNIFIDLNGVIRVAEFGMSKVS